MIIVAGQDAILEPDPVSEHVVTDLFGCHSFALYPVSMGNEFTLILVPDAARGQQLCRSMLGTACGGPGLSNEVQSWSLCCLMRCALILFLFLFFVRAVEEDPVLLVLRCRSV